jgi:hypothetical protein
MLLSLPISQRHSTLFIKGQPPICAAGYFTREEAELLGLDGYKIDTFSSDYDEFVVLSLKPMEPRLAPFTGAPFGAIL